MTRYRVTISHDACTTHDVEAGSPEDATERAMEDCGSVSLCHHCSDELQMGDPIRAACVENLDDGTHIDAVDPEVAALRARVAELEAAARIIDLDARRYRWLRNESWAGYNRGIGVWTEDGAGNRKTMLAEGALDAAVDSGIGRKDPPAEYAYSIDRGDTFKGAHQTIEAALAAAHDDLASQCAVGTAHQVQVARLVPGVEVIRGLPHSVRYLAERAIDDLRDALYDEIGGNNPLVERLSPEQRQQVGTAILETIAATGAIVGKGLDICAEHTVVIA